MIIREFLSLTQTASASRRAEAAVDLARAYLYGDLTADQAWEAKTALLTLLDDPSPLVRRALAETCAASARTPRPLVVALSCDVPEVARLVLARSPVLTDADLVDAAALADEATRTVIAARHHLSHAVSGALAEIGERGTLVALAANPTAKITAGRMLRMLERHGDAASLREALLARAELPPEVRHAIGLAVARSLADYVTTQGWIGVERCERMSHEAAERAALEACEDHAAINRAMRSPQGFAELHRRAGLPDSLLPAMQAALAALPASATRAGSSRRGTGLSRRMIESAISACSDLPAPEMQAVVALLTRYEAEAARDEAREAARAIAAEAATRETARREAQAADAAWRAALDSQRRTSFAAAADAAEHVALAPDQAVATGGPLNPVGAILDALPDQILDWYRTEEPATDPEVQAATDAVLAGLDESLRDLFRASRPDDGPAPEGGLQIAA
jgi:uncharacterized protein (DUF2336 family)